MSFSKNRWLTFFLKIFRILILSLVCFATDVVFTSILITGRMDKEYIRTYWDYSSLNSNLCYLVVIIVIAIASTAIAHRAAFWLHNKSKLLLSVFSFVCGVLLVLVLKYGWYLLISTT
jgi:hypothetical protein